MKSREFREMARENLKERWGDAAVLTLVYVAILLVIAAITKMTGGMLGIVVFIILPVISFGFMKEMILFRQGQSVSCIDFLKLGFQEFAKVWKVYGRVLLKQIGPIILYMLGFFALIFSAVFLILVSAGLGLIEREGGSSYQETSNYLRTSTLETDAQSSYQDEWNQIMDQILEQNPELQNVEIDENALGVLAIIGIAGLGIGLLFLFIASIWAIPIAYRYMFVYNEMAYEPQLSAKEIVQKSGNAMKGNRWKAFKLFFTFLGWYFLAMILLGIPFLWISPYMSIASIFFYEFVTNRNGDRVEEVEQGTGSVE